MAEDGCLSATPSAPRPCTRSMHSLRVATCNDKKRCAALCWAVAGIAPPPQLARTHMLLCRQLPLLLKLPILPNNIKVTILHML